MPFSAALSRALIAARSSSSMPATWPLTSERRTLPILVRTAERTMRLRTRLRSLERMRFRAERELAKMTPVD